MIANLLKWVANVSKWVSGIIVGIIVILNFIAVIMRYLFKHPIMWCEEVSLVLFIIVISLALIAMTHSQNAVKLDFFIDIMPSRLSKWMGVLANLVCFICLGTVSILGVLLSHRSQFRYTAILRLPYSFIYLAMAVGMAISALIYGYYTVKDISSSLNKKEAAKS